MNIIRSQPKNTIISEKNSTQLVAQGCAYLNGKIYTFGGQTASNISNLSFVYDLSAKTWSSIADLPVALSYPQVVVVNNDIYIHGGRTALSGGTVSSAIYRYDPIANTYTTLSSVGSPAVGGASCNFFNVSGVNYIYIFGGFTVNETTTQTGSINRYNISTDTWSLIGATIPGNEPSFTGSGLGTANANLRFICGSFKYNNRHWIIGYNMKYYSFNPDTGTLTAERDIYKLNVDSHNAAVCIGTKVYLHGTRAGGPTTPTTYVLELSPKITSRRINTPSYSSIGQLLTDGTNIYLVTGQTPDGGAIETRVITYTPDNQGTVSLSTPTVISDFSLGTGGWSLANPVTAGVGKWATGSSGNSGAATGTSAYISTNNGLTAGYLASGTSTSHIYRTIAVPSDYAGYRLSFKIYINGELIGGTKFDYANVIVNAPGAFPVAGTLYSQGELVLSEATLSAQTIDYDVSAYRGSSLLLIFTWRNDSSAGNLGITPGVTIDDVRLERYILS